MTTQSSSRSEQLAKRLKDAGAKMYGAFWCSHCHEQKEAFGSQAMKDFPYVECYPDGFHKVSNQSTLACCKLTAGLNAFHLLLLYIDCGDMHCMHVSLPRWRLTSSVCMSDDCQYVCAAAQAADFEHCCSMATYAGLLQFDDLATQCKDAKIQAFPAWIIKGQTYPGAQTFDKLEKILDTQ